jgi:hypothetical protein
LVFPAQWAWQRRQPLLFPPNRGLGQSPSKSAFLSRIFKIGFSIEGVEINALKTEGGWIEMAQQ